MSNEPVPGEKVLYRSKKVQKVAVSEILLTGARANRMRREGADVIILGAGEPDFDTPQNVKEAAIAALREGKTKYTALEGTIELRSAISSKLKNENGLEYSASEIIVSCGAKHVIYNAFAATLDEGDEVIIPAPYWTSYEDMVLINGGTPKIVACSEEKAFKLTASMLKGAITSRTRWVMLNSPSNPTGAAYSISELEEILDVVRRYPRLLLISDEIYEHIVYDGYNHVSPAKLAPDLRNRILVVNGVSKAYAMTGFRIGWGAGPAELISAMAVVQSQTTSSASSIGQAAALAALEGPQDEVILRAKAFEERRNYLLSSFSRINGITCATPMGAFYLFPNIKGLLGAVASNGRKLRVDRDVTDYLLEVAHVALLPGSAFGLPGYMRLSYAASLASLTTAMERISSAVHDLYLKETCRASQRTD